MKVAIVGSRDLQVRDLGMYLPEGATEIISGGARGIDTCAREYALANDLKLTEFLPDYAQHGKAAPLKRNWDIVKAADQVLALWDGQSRGTAYTINLAKQLGKPVEVKIIASGRREI